MFIHLFGFSVILLYIEYGRCDEVCNRIPLGITSAALPPDNRYRIQIDKIGEDYLPDSNYTVYLKAEGKATFIAFSISLTGDTKYNPENPRRPINLKPGVIWPSGDEDNAKFSSTCNNTVVENHVMPKSLVQVTWRTPPKGNGCVTISAMVAIRRDIYYSNQGPLTTRVCEDNRKLEDMPPKSNPNCRACHDAKYRLTFEGLWSYNTHLKLYPSSNKSSVDQASFSDIVGASHNNDYTIFKSNEEASDGVRTLAEQGNTTILEVDMQQKIGKSVRTIIKANSPPTTTSNKTVMFRVSAQHHLVSVATAILPSPDWFLGASGLELCNETNSWTEHITLNLYPLDAGTDKGTDFNSANDIMMPAQPIGLTKFMHIGKDNVKPFARIHLDLIRIYELTPGCFNKSEDEGNLGEGDGGGEDRDGSETPEENTEEQAPTITTSSEPPMTDPDSTADCPMTTWGEWEPCDGPCEGGAVVGARARYRYHIVDDVPVMYNEKGTQPEVPIECLNNFDDIETSMCEEKCEENTSTTVDPLVAEQRVAPGRSWRIWS